MEPDGPDRPTHPVPVLPVLCCRLHPSNSLVFVYPPIRCEFELRAPFASKPSPSERSRQYLATQSALGTGVPRALVRGPQIRSERKYVVIVAHDQPAPRRPFSIKSAPATATVSQISVEWSR